MLGFASHRHAEKKEKIWKAEQAILSQRLGRCACNSKSFYSLYTRIDEDGVI
jgi:hypothetical protein